MVDEVVSLTGARLAFGDRVLWDHLDLKVSAGEFIAILGPNGTGKTSLLKVLLQAGFGKMFRVGAEGQNLEINVLAFKGEPDPAFRTLFGLPEAG